MMLWLSLFSSIRASTFLEQNPALQNPQCRINFNSLNDDWEVRMRAHAAGFNFINRHKIFDCPPSDSLNLSQREEEFKKSFRNLTDADKLREYIKSEAIRKGVDISDESVALLTELVPYARRAYLAQSSTKLARIFNALGRDKISDASLIKNLAEIHGKFTKDILQDQNLKLSELKTQLDAKDVRQTLEAWEALMLGYRRDLVILGSEGELDRIIKDNTTAGKEITFAATTKFIRDGMKKVRNAAIGEHRKPIYEYSREQWLRFEMAEVAQKIGRDFFTDLLQPEDECLFTLPLKQVLEHKELGPRLDGCPVRKEMSERLEVVRKSLMLTLGIVHHSKPIAAVMLYLKGLIPPETLLKVHFPIKDATITPEESAVWFQDRLEKYYVGDLFAHQPRKTVTLVKMIRKSLSKLSEMPELLGDQRLRMLDLHAQLSIYSLSHHYSYLCLNSWILNEMPEGGLVMISPTCLKHALAAIVRRESNDSYNLHVINSGLGLRAHNPGPDNLTSPTASFRLWPQQFFDIDWMSTNWPVGALNEYSTIYPHHGRYVAPWEILEPANKQPQEGHTCTARSLRIGIQFLMGDAFYRRLKAQIALDWLPALNLALQTSLAEVKNYRSFLKRWGILTDGLNPSIANLFVLNTVLSLFERVVSSERQSRPAWLVKVNSEIVAKARQLGKLLDQSLDDKTKRIFILRSNKYTTIRKESSLPIAEDLGYGAAVSWCQMDYYNPFLFGWQPFLNTVDSAESILLEHCPRSPTLSASDKEDLMLMQRGLTPNDDPYLTPDDDDYEPGQENPIGISALKLEIHEPRAQTNRPENRGTSPLKERNM